MDEIVTALLAWAVGSATLDALISAVAEARERLAALRVDDAPLTLATAHATKGLEFDHVIVVGMEAGRFPSARAVGSADDPVRAYEEERRLAYVAWTRARRSLTLLYDPAVPSPFLLEAFDAEELGLEASAA
jgi:DNA helicase-2/ATP-dependent DNA helicase PcrA